MASTGGPGQGSSRGGSPRRRPTPVTLGAHPRIIDSPLTPPTTPLLHSQRHFHQHSLRLADMASERDQLDLFFLTFNCAKTPIDVDVFARHLRGALVQRGNRKQRHPGEVRVDGEQWEEDTGLGGVEQEEGGIGDGLPDLVVFSLQEIAPLTYGYLGGQFLAPYLNPFKEALNLAALDSLGGNKSPRTPTPDDQNPRASLQRSKSTLSSLFRRQPDYPYKLIEARNVGMTAIMLFARRPDAIHHIQHAECAFGIANMGNKGAIALRVTYAADKPLVDELRGDVGGDSAEDERKVAEITFVATHLAAMEYNLRRRNANWASVCSSCLFEDPTKIIPEKYHLSGPGAKNVVEASTHSSSTASNAKQTDGGQDIPSETEEEQAALVARWKSTAAMPHEYMSHMRDISIFKPGTHLFVGGDLNYRISTTTPHALSTFPDLKTYPNFFQQDQLTQERVSGRALRGLSEARVKFPPTYKIKHLSHEKADSAINKEEFEAAVEEGREDEIVPWKWAPNRWPSWCDRILFLDIPRWVKRRFTDEAGDGGGSSSNQAPEIKTYSYDSLPTMRTSDHQPVFLRASVPLLPPGALLKTESEEEDVANEDKNDPRCELPVPIDTGAFARRAAARRREVITGMTALFFSTKEGAIVVGVVTVLGFWTWWLYTGLS